jgi:hypothetical protein
MRVSGKILENPVKILPLTRIKETKKTVSC